MAHRRPEAPARRGLSSALALLALLAPAFLAWRVADAAAAAAPERRIALVIGNGAYASGPLRNPTNDAQLMAETLAAVGFEVISRRDADQATMKRAIQEFGARLEAAGPQAVGLFYYAGHGVQLAGRNYLIPTRARIDREGDVDIEAVSADWVLDQMRFARNRLNLVILDACRNNPFVRSLRSADRGLARMDAPAGILIAYSTAPGDVAADGEGRNSPYSAALSQAIRESREPVEQVFKRTRLAVRAATSDRQTPWEASSLTGDFFFAEGAADARPQPAPSPARPPAVSLALPPVSSASRLPSDAAPAARRSGDACQEPVGRWKVSGIEGEVAVQADHSLEWWQHAGDRFPSVTGNWSCQSATGRRFVLIWAHGSIDSLSLSADGRALTGKNQFALPIAMTRLP